tara:strand:- start:271 stop:465 length:195 start_codon:yes stop_codon:yes gene_type:complete
MKDSDINQPGVPSEQTSHIANFINEIAGGNYAEANKYLKNTVNSKISDRIKAVKKINIFNKNHE